MATPVLDVHPGTGKGTAISDFQRALDPKLAWNQGYRAIIVKFSQGTGKYDPANLKDYVHRMQQFFNNMGAYHFLDATASGAAQARHFASRLKAVYGRADGKDQHGRDIAIVIDFEGYSGDGWDLSPTNGHLRDFVRELRKFVGRHKIGVYSNHGFWTTGKPSGNIHDYDIDYIYDSRYPYSSTHVLVHPIAAMKGALDWYRKQDGWGGSDPYVWQGSGAGYVGKVVCDGNLMFVGWAQMVGKSTLSPPKPPSEASTGAATVNAELLKHLHYVEGGCNGPGKYVPWVSGRFGSREPAYVGGSLPTQHYIYNHGGFCAMIPNLMMHHAGIQHVDLSNAWFGGVLWYGEFFIDQKGVAHPFRAGHDYPPGTLFISRYRGAALKDQGHVAVMSSDGKHLVQSDGADGYAGNGLYLPGPNTKRTLAETQQMLIRLDGRGFDHVVYPKDWII